MFNKIRFLITITTIYIATSTVYADGIGMVTGSSTGTYIKFGKDIARVSKTEGINIIVKESKGSVANIKRLASTENAALAIVQSDVLGYLSKSTNPKFKKHASKLRLIFPFYNEEVHLFANKEIKSIEDLKGKKVVVGTQGSGTNMTVWNLLNIMGISPGEKIYKSSKEGVSMVLKGQADAVFYVAGKPVQLFTNLFKTKSESVIKLLDNLHFVPLDSKEMLAEYVRADLKPDDYSSLEDTVPTVAVKAMLVSFNFADRKNKYYQARCKQLGKIGKAIRSEIDNLRKTGHKKWNEVDLELKVGSWELDKCSRDGVGGGTSNSSNTSGNTEMDRSIECALEGKC